MKKKAIEYLKKYRNNIQTIDLIELEIQELNDILADDEQITILAEDTQVTVDREHVSSPSKASKKFSSVETKLLMKERIIENIKRRRGQFTAKLHRMKAEQRLVNTALKAVSEEERFVIRCRYIEKYTWAKTELKFNDTFNEYLTDGALKKRMDKSLNEIGSVLDQASFLVGKIDWGSSEGLI